MTSPNQHPLSEQANMIEQNPETWDARMQSLMAQDAHIITFRGAGSVNGIDPQQAGDMSGTLTAYITELGKDGKPVALIYDGDEDNRQKPDVGSVFGQTVDALENIPAEKRPSVTAIAAQTAGWYYPKTEGGALESVTGTPYETYVFSDELVGGHARLTQSDDLVAYPRYQQVFVGPAGKIAESQLKDLSDKAVKNRTEDARSVQVLVFNGHNNERLTPELHQKLADAPDEKARQNIRAKIEQRSNAPYGVLCNDAGELNVDYSKYPGVDIDEFGYETHTTRNFYIDRFTANNPNLLAAQAQSRAEYRQNAAELTALVDGYFTEPALAEKITADDDGTQHLHLYRVWRSSGSRRPVVADLEITRKAQEGGIIITDFGFLAKDGWPSAARAVTTPDGITRVYHVRKSETGKVSVQPESARDARTWKDNLEKAFAEPLTARQMIAMRAIGSRALPSNIRPE